jgi:recombination protein RecT
MTKQEQDMKNALAEQNTKPALTGSLTSLLKSEEIKGRFNKMLGKRSAGFLSNVLSITNNNKLLAAADPMTILTAASVAASLDLSIVPSLGEAHIVPYKNNATGKVVAQFQIGWRGFVQLAQRTGLYRTINAGKIYEGQLKATDLLTGMVDLDKDGKKSDTVIGYFAFFELLNGFRKALYISKDDAIKHGRRFSKSFDTGMWTKDVDAMATKTCVKQLLDKWAPKSVDYQMQRAIETDQAVIKEDGTPDYIDNGEAIDIDATLPDEKTQAVLDSFGEEKK